MVFQLHRALLSAQIVGTCSTRLQLSSVSKLGFPSSSSWIGFAPYQQVSTTRAYSTWSTSSPMSSSNELPKVIATRALSDQDAKWVSLNALEWVDESGKHRTWECANRRTRKGEVDAVSILPLLSRGSAPPSEVLLVSQFRPPVGSVVLELPAGLVDAGEEGKEGSQRTALRELWEETGYGQPPTSRKEEVQDGSEAAHAAGTAEAITTSDVLPSDPGLTGSTLRIVVVHVRLPEGGANPKAHLDAGEAITTHIVPLTSLYTETVKLAKELNATVDGRFAHLAVGIQLASALGLPSPLTQTTSSTEEPDASTNILKRAFAS